MLRFHPLRLRSRTDIAEDAVCLAFEVPDTLRDEYRFAAGQHLALRIDAGGEERRTYSIVSAEGSAELRIGVRVRAQGRVSPFLARRLAVGETVDVLTPNGSFHTQSDPARAGRFVAFAAGSGITPVLSIAATVLAREPHSRFTLFFGNRSTASTMFLEDLMALKNRHPARFAVHFLMSREPQEIELLNGRVDAAHVREFARVLFNPQAVDEFFLCGPGSMNDDVAATLRELGAAGRLAGHAGHRRDGWPAPDLHHGARRCRSARRRRRRRHRAAVLVPRGRVLDLPREGAQGRGCDGAEPRARRLGSRCGLRAVLPGAAHGLRARDYLRRIGRDMPYETIAFDIARGIARLTLNRPEKLNSFNATMHGEVRAALARVVPGGGRVLVITGAGRAFCAGQDLADRAVAPGGTAVDLGESIERNYKPLVLALRGLPVPVIAAVNGVAAGAGANIALACDLVVAARSASFIQSFCKLGLVPDSGGTWILPRLVGPARASGLALLGEKLAAETAEQWGLIWRCVDDSAFPATIEALAAQLAVAPTRGLARTKQALHESWERPLAAQLDVERDLQAELGRSADYAEGVAAFVGKRPPLFAGK